MTLDNINPPRLSFWLSYEDRQDLQQAIALVCLEGIESTTLATLEEVLADLGIAEARLDSSTGDASQKWRVALGKGESDIPIQLSPHELDAVRLAHKYATSDRVKKLLA